MLQAFRLSPQQKHSIDLYGTEGIHKARLVCSLYLSGSLDRSALKKALHAVVDRHEICRTFFRAAPGLALPLQYPAAEGSLLWSETEGFHGDNLEEAHALGEAHCRNMPFNLDKGPLLGAHLVAHTENDHVLCLNFSVLHADRPSLALFFQDLAAAYEGRLGEGEEGPPLQYVESSDWTHELLESEDAEAGRAYWGEHLFRLLTDPELPTQRRREAPPTYSASTLHKLDGEVFETLTAFADEQQTPPPVVCLAVWQALLMRNTGEMLTLGVAFNGREDEDTAGMMGPDVRYLPLVGMPLSGKNLVQIVAEVTAACEDAASFKECFVWDDLKQGMKHDLGYSFAFEASPMVEPLTTGDLTWTVLGDTPSDSGPFLVKLSIAVGETEMELTLHYDAVRLDEGFVRRLGTEYHTFLARALAQPTAALATHALITDGERSLILQAFNDQSDRLATMGVAAAFERHAVSGPSAPALSCDNEVLDYESVHQRANQLAHYLIKLGVGPGTYVGVCLHRGLDVAIGLLGIAKAGAAYLPMEPDYPEERLAYMLRDCNARAVFTSHDLVSRFPGHMTCFLAANFEGEATHTPKRWYHPQAPAYAIYTSGSTGRPKGIVVSNEALAHHINSAAHVFGITAEDRVLCFTAFIFDPSIEQMLVSLTKGACVVIRGDGMWSADGLDARIRNQMLSVVNFPASYWHLLVDVWQRTPPDLGPQFRLCIAGAEKVLPDKVRGWVKLKLEGVRLLNAYGPTETTITATVAELDEASLEKQTQVPIGRPLPNRRCHIVDAHWNPTPIGLPGELLIAGEGVAAGYLSLPAMTADHFVPDPFGGKAGSRLYRTGDLATYQEDGNIQFLGRIDAQIKVRGYRIELGEVEQVLSAHEAVREALVALVDTTGTEATLVAFYTAVEPLDPHELHDYLGAILPAYMIPGMFVPLAELPRLPSGKINRKILPELIPAPEDTLQGEVAFNTMIEELVAGIWADLLGKARIGREANFFDLGGHSLMAMQLVSRIRTAFNIELTLLDVFSNPQLAEMAETVALKQKQVQGACLPVLEVVPRSAYMPLSYTQRRMWMASRAAEAGAYRTPASFKVFGPLNIEALRAAFGAVVGRHEILRTTYRLGPGNEPVQEIHEAEEWHLPLTRLDHLSIEEREVAVADISAKEAVEPFDLEHGPLLRTRLLQLSEESWLVLISMHHIVTDGWSMGIMTHELNTCYAAFAGGTTPALQEPKRQYVDYAVWQHNWMQGASYDREIAFWRDRLAGAPPVQSLPLDHPRNAGRTFLAQRHPLDFGTQLSNALDELGRSTGTTPFMIFLSGLKALLFCTTGAQDLIVGTDIANRSLPGTDDLMGPFLNHLPLRSQIMENTTFEALLLQVRRITLDAYAHQELPFDRMVEELCPHREPGVTPFFQAKLTLQNMKSTALFLGDLRIEPVLVPNKTAKIDLHLVIVPVEGCYRGYFMYASELFEPETIATLDSGLKLLLSQAVAQPQIPLMRLKTALDDAARNARNSRRSSGKSKRADALKNILSSK